MEIEVGEYIRTTDGIRKLVEINTGTRKTYYGQYILDKKYKGSYSIAEKNILKHSKNIIDLIEEGDFVNGKQIECILETSIKVKDVAERILCFETDFPIEKGLRTYHNCDIKSIVTKEQFKNIEYRLE